MMLSTATLALLGIGAAACGEPPPPPDLDDLMTQLDMARSDSQLASDAAAVAKPGTRPALAAVSADRSKHAEALAAEIARMTGEPMTSTSSTTTTSATQPSPPTTKDVVASLRTSAEGATKAAAQLSGYRAGLLGSIAASCTAAYTVALA